ncbi:sugar-binding transcriptional regulator [Kocuria sp. M1R5S2]|uniref:sugar-binding transcriptional regulator n=1 Tax=Kocuria rhizosphaerae TaxID=3376285 RepID=UPI0037AB5A92
MPAPRESAMLARAARMYYLENRSQSDIALALGVSRSNISRILTAAREAGIVEIRIHEPVARGHHLEEALQEKFRIGKCLVAVGGPHRSALDAVGSVGAAWLRDHIDDARRIALSWGRTVQSVVTHLEEGPPHPDLEVFPLVGGFSTVDASQNPNAVARGLASKLGAHYRPLLAPAVVRSVKTRDTLLTEPAIGEVLKDAGKADIAIIGIGSIHHGSTAAIVESMAFTEEEAERFENSPIVGDACTRFFDAEGRLVSSPADERVISIDLETLKAIRTVVAVAEGAQKARAVSGALRGGLVDVLVVDRELAEALLEA